MGRTAAAAASFEKVVTMSSRSLCLIVGVGITALLGLAGCQPGELTVVEPDGSDDGPSLGTLVAQVEFRATDSALADSLGWEAGVPGARVRILRNGTAEWLEAETDDAGVAVHEDLQPGQYISFVERRLTEVEARRTSGKIRGFGGGAILRMGAGTVASSYRVRASRRTDLVISEVSSAAPPAWEVPGTAENGNYFFEVYNQSASTKYLDGLIFGQFPLGLLCHGCANSCSYGEPVRTDSTGMYFRSVIQFPGTGSDYPIQPGGTKLIAVSAQDHRDLHEDMLDLRGADFEIGGSGLADNPSVPNMIQAGTRAFTPAQLLTTTSVWFLAEPFDPVSQPVSWRNVHGRGYRRVPLAFVLDVVTTKYVWPERDAEHPECDPMIHPTVDGLPGGFQEGGEPNVRGSVQRRPLTTEDGIPILMDTNTSASDFEMMRYTPGELPQ